jgi:AraC-like DNA-binding protein
MATLRGGWKGEPPRSGRPYRDPDDFYTIAINIAFFATQDGLDVMPGGHGKPTSLTLEERPLRHAHLEAPAAIDTSLSERFAVHPQVLGKIKRLAVRPGFNITAFDVKSADVFRGFASTERCLAIVVLLDCSGSSRMLTPGCNRALEFTYTPDTTILFFARTAVQGEFAVPTGANFRGVEVRLSVDQLSRLDALELFADVDAEHSYCRAANADVWVGGIPTNTLIRARAEAALDAALGSDGTDLEIEIAGLAILTAALEQMRSRGSVLSARQRHLSGKLDRARSVLLEDVARSWTVSDLAEAVGLSERQLKTGFRTRFGAPVYEYLQNARLSKAKTLLADGDLSITDVALTVGYANPSHFAFLFRRTFGIPPSQLARPKR